MTTPRIAVGIIDYGDYRHLPVCLDNAKLRSLGLDDLCDWQDALKAYLADRKQITKEA